MDLNGELGEDDLFPELPGKFPVPRMFGGGLGRLAAPTKATASARAAISRSSRLTVQPSIDKANRPGDWSKHAIDLHAAHRTNRSERTNLARAQRVVQQPRAAEERRTAGDHIVDEHEAITACHQSAVDHHRPDVIL